MSKMALPAKFSHLEMFVGKWDLPDTNKRYAERLKSSFSELEAFHAAIKKALPDIQAHLDAKNFEDYDDEDRTLARLAFAWAPVAEAVEVFKQPRVPDSKMYWDVQVEPEL